MMIPKSVAVVSFLLAAPSAAFVPSSRPSRAAARKSSLNMSAALIVQNKGGGHGELGTSIYLHISLRQEEIMTDCIFL